MGYRRGYDCDICGKVSEKDSDFIGLETLDVGGSQSTVPDCANIHICIPCARVIMDCLMELDSQKRPEGRL